MKLKEIVDGLKKAAERSEWAEGRDTGEVERAKAGLADAIEKTCRWVALMAPLGTLQLTRAHALAAHYGHYWAQGLLRDLPDNPAAICEHVTTGVDPQDTGINHPDVDDAGYVVHTTVSGRLSWAIDKDGTTVLRVNRPSEYGEEYGGETVAYVTVGHFGGPRSEAELLKPGRFHQRHLAALADALYCITTPEAVHGWAALEAAALPNERDGVGCGSISRPGELPDAPAEG